MDVGCASVSYVIRAELPAIQTAHRDASSQSSKGEPRFVHGDVPLYPMTRGSLIFGIMEVQVLSKRGM
jgi:hypothetical protein